MLCRRSDASKPPTTSTIACMGIPLVLPGLLEELGMLLKQGLRLGLINLFDRTLSPPKRHLAHERIFPQDSSATMHDGTVCGCQLFLESNLVRHKEFRVCQNTVHTQNRGTGTLLSATSASYPLVSSKLLPIIAAWSGHSLTLFSRGKSARR